MPKTYRVYWTVKLYKDVEAKSADHAVEICHNSDPSWDGTYIDDSYEIYKVTKPDKNGYDVNKPNLLEE